MRKLLDTYRNDSEDYKSEYIYHREKEHSNLSQYYKGKYQATIHAHNLLAIEVGEKVLEYDAII